MDVDSLPDVDELPADVDDVSDPKACEICGEAFRFDAFGWYAPNEEVGEFWEPSEDETQGKSLIAHAQCGLDRGLETA